MSIKQLFHCLILGIAPLSSQAVEVVFYDFDNVPGQTTFINQARRLDTNLLSASAWSAGLGGTLDQGGVGAPGNQNQTNARAVGAAPTVFFKTVGLGTPPVPTNLFLWDPDQSLGFTFRIENGFKLDLTEVSFAERFGGGGGLARTFEKWQLKINEVNIAQGDALLSSPEAFDTHVVPLDVKGLTGQVSLRFFGIGPFGTDPAGDDAGQGGNWRLDNFQLSGNFSAVPLPATVWLMGAALASLAAGRRKTALN